MTDITPDIILLKARDLIDKGWCQNSFAINAKGDPCSSQDKDAVKFCALGAVARAARHYNQSSFSALMHIQKFTDDLGLMAYNDFRTKEEVLAAFDKAIDQWPMTR